ncbi:MAG: BrnT family toxin [Terriglobia bacterium]
MHIEWDASKATANIKKHRVSFDEAVTVFYDPMAATFGDPGHSQIEDRLITVGYSARGRLLVISHVEREGAVRVISARRATRRERKRHEGEDPGSGG